MAQVNRKEYENSAFGPWERCVAAVLFTGPWSPQPDEDPAKPAGWNSMEHFVAYVKGAADIE